MTGVTSVCFTGGSVVTGVVIKEVVEVVDAAGTLVVVKVGAGIESVTP